MPVIELLSTPVFNAITWSLLYSLWQAGIIYALTWMLLKVNKQAPAYLKHNLAAGAQLIIAIWMVITFTQQLQLNVDSYMASAAGKASLYSAPLFGGTSQTSQVTQSPLLQPNITVLLPVFLLLYLAGLLLMGWRMLLGYQGTRQLRKQSHSAAGGELVQLLENIQVSLQVKQKVQLYISSLVNSPIMIGFFKPVILLPVTIFTQLSPEQVRAVLIHEIAHIRRNDYLINLLQSVLESILFFNPFVWLLSRVLRAEREKACDDWVVQQIAPESYASALLSLEVSRREAHLAMAAKGHGQYPLLNRIKAFTMKTQHRSKTSFKQKIISVALVLLSISCLAWLTPTNSEKQTSKKEKVSTSYAPQKDTTIHQKKVVVAASSKVTKDAAQQQITVSGNGQWQADTSILSAELQASLKELEASAKQMSSSFQENDQWDAAVNALKENAAALSNSMKMDPKMLAQFEKLSQDAKTMAQQSVNSHAFKSRMKELQLSAEKIKDRADTDSIWGTAAAEAISKNAKQLVAQFKQDPEWHDRIKALQQQATTISSQFVNNPEWDKAVQELVQQASGLSKSIMENPAFKKQLEQIKRQANELKAAAEKGSHDKD